MNTPGCIFQHVMSEEHFFPCRRRFPVSCNCCPASWCSCRRLWIRRREEIPLCHVRLSRHGHPSYTPLHPLLPLHRLKSLTCHRKLEGVLYHSPAVSEQNQPLFTLKSLTVVKCASSLGLWFKKKLNRCVGVSLMWPARQLRKCWRQIPKMEASSSDHPPWPTTTLWPWDSRWPGMMIHISLQFSSSAVHHVL